MKKTILVINGPNLNLLGKREPEIYGNQTLEAVMGGLVTLFPYINFEFVQSNHEGIIVDRLNVCVEKTPDGIIINGGAFTHYSYSIYDALKMLDLPKVEVHISHIFNREEFRKTSVIAPACDTMISGAGALGYELAVRVILKNE